MKWLQQLLRRLVVWAVEDYMDAVTKLHLATITTAAHASRDHLAKENGKQWRLINGKFDALREQISALQAIDVDYHESGQIIVLANVSGRAVVKTVKIPKNMPLPEMKQLVDDIERRYGAPPLHVDTPSPFLEQYLWEGREDYRRARNKK